jgi:hypothetical protein
MKNLNHLAVVSILDNLPAEELIDVLREVISRKTIGEVKNIASLFVNIRDIERKAIGEAARLYLECRNSHKHEIELLPELIADVKRCVTVVHSGRRFWTIKTRWNIEFYENGRGCTPPDLVQRIIPLLDEFFSTPFDTFRDAARNLPFSKSP